MSYYALVASLPNLQIGDEPPFSVEDYISNAAQWVTEREVEILRAILLNETDHATCTLCKTWNDIETQLRNAAARQRAQKLGVDVKGYLQPHDGFSGDVENYVRDAFARNDPLETEEELDRARWTLAEELIDQDPFSFKKVLAYGIQLKIVERWSAMDVHVGKEQLEAVITANTQPEEPDAEAEEVSA